MKESDARKLFKFIDFNEARVISKHQIRLLILYSKDVVGDKTPGEMIRKLSKMLFIPDLKVFDEHLFAFFFMSKQPFKALQHMPQKSFRLPQVSRSIQMNNSKQSLADGATKSPQRTINNESKTQE